MLNQLNKELKIALKTGDKSLLLGLRNIIGKLKTSQIDKGEPLTKEESLQILQTSAKQLRESVDQYKKGGRDDLADKELFELSVLEKYLPEQLSQQKIQQLVKETIQSVGAKSIQDLGKVMGKLMKELGGSVDGKLVQNIVRDELN